MFPFQIGPLGRVRANARGRARATHSDLFSEPPCKSAREYIRSSSLARTNRADAFADYKERTITAERR